MNLHYNNLSLDDIVYLDDNSVECVEVWKDVPYYEGLYKISDLGRVKSLSRLRRSGKGYFISKPMILKQSKSSHYLSVRLFNDTYKVDSIHKFMAIAFLNHIPCGFKLVVDHINNNHLDNRLQNLQIITSRNNSSKNKVNRKCKYTGVVNSGEKFRAFIYNNGKTMSLGTFKTQEEASLYYKNAVKSIENGDKIVVKKSKFSSKYNGVTFDKNTRKWISNFTMNGKTKYIGVYKTELEAFKGRENFLNK